MRVLRSQLDDLFAAMGTPTAESSLEDVQQKVQELDASRLDPDYSTGDDEMDDLLDEILRASELEIVDDSKQWTTQRAEIVCPECGSKLGTLRTRGRPRKSGRPPGRPAASGLSQMAAALKILEEEGRPMKCKEIIELCGQRGYWSSPGGRTPEAALFSQFSKEIRLKGDASRVIKAGPGLFALQSGAIGVE